MPDRIPPFRTDACPVNRSRAGGTGLRGEALTPARRGLQTDVRRSDHRYDIAYQPAFGPATRPDGDPTDGSGSLGLPKRLPTLARVYAQVSGEMYLRG